MSTALTHSTHSACIDTVEAAYAASGSPLSHFTFPILDDPHQRGSTIANRRSTDEATVATRNGACGKRRGGAVCATFRYVSSRTCFCSNCDCCNCCLKTTGNKQRRVAHNALHALMCKLRIDCTCFCNWFALGNKAAHICQFWACVSASSQHTCMPPSSTPHVLAMSISMPLTVCFASCCCCGGSCVRC